MEEFIRKVYSHHLIMTHGLIKYTMFSFMFVDFVAGNGLGRAAVQRAAERHRRVWSRREEEIMISTLKDLAALGWKSDNGFRAGYLAKVEEALRREFPTTDLKVNPNITSKISAWKKNYYSLQGVLNHSGVGFNLRGDFMVDCDDQQWEQIIRVGLIFFTLAH